MYFQKQQHFQLQEGNSLEPGLGPNECFELKQLSLRDSGLCGNNPPLQRSDTITSLGSTSDTKNPKVSLILALGKTDHKTEKKVQEFIFRQTNCSPKLPLYTTCFEKKAMECRYMAISRLGSNSTQKESFKDLSGGNRQRIYSEQLRSPSCLHNEGVGQYQTPCKQFKAGISSLQKSQAYVVGTPEPKSREMPDSESSGSESFEPKTPPKRKQTVDILSKSSGLSGKSKTDKEAKTCKFESDLAHHRMAYEAYDYAIDTEMRLACEKIPQKRDPISPKSGHFSEHKRNSRQLGYKVLLIDFDETIHPTKYKKSKGIRTQEDIPPSQVHDFYFLDYQVVASGSFRRVC